MTKKIILLSLVFGTSLWATSSQFSHFDRERNMHTKKIQHPLHKKVQHSFKKKVKYAKPIRRTFKTAKEYNHVKRRHHKVKRHMRPALDDRFITDNNYYANHHARGYRHYKNSWYRVFKNHKASFYDNEGFYYGYFNRIGYTFEGEFYRYDRYYTYRDRVRGKGLFSHRYFKPLRAYSSYRDRASRWQR